MGFTHTTSSQYTLHQMDLVSINVQALKRYRNKARMGKIPTHKVFFHQHNTPIGPSLWSSAGTIHSWLKQLTPQYQLTDMQMIWKALVEHQTKQKDVHDKCIKAWVTPIHLSKSHFQNFNWINGRYDSNHDLNWARSYWIKTQIGSKMPQK